MSWTNTCTTEYYQRFVRRYEENFSEETRKPARADLRQARLLEYAEIEA